MDMKKEVKHTVWAHKKYTDRSIIQVLTKSADFQE